IANPRGDLKAITTRSGVSYDGPPIPPPFSSLPKVVERVPKVTKDTVQPSTENIQPSIVQTQVQIDELVVAPNPKPTIPYPLRVTKLKLREKDDNLALKFVEILGSYISFLASQTANPTPISDPIIALSSPSLTLFEGGDFILEEIEACLASKPIPSGIDDTDFDLEGDIRIDKLPVINYKELKDEEKYALLKVLKSHKRAITWKISDIKENLAADHLSRLENPHQDELEKMEITETFPL
nr:hypothetical protein [Tanacetum cinerariifolium]